MKITKQVRLAGFALPKYEPSRKFTNAQWADQILFRLALRAAIATKGSADQAMKAWLVDQIASLFSRPVADRGYIFRTPAMVRQEPQRLVFGQAVNDVYVLREVLDVLGHTPNAHQTSLSVGDRMLVDAAIAPTNMYGLGKYARVLVDLTGNDTAIRNDFKDWLSKRRSSEIDATAGVSSASIDEKKKAQWVKNAVLPYVDITAWAAFNEELLTNEDLFDLLFPNGRATASRRAVDPKDALKAVKRDAKYVISHSVVQALSASST